MGIPMVRRARSFAALVAVVTVGCGGRLLESSGDAGAGDDTSAPDGAGSVGEGIDGAPSAEPDASFVGHPDASAGPDGSSVGTSDGASSADAVTTVLDAALPPLDAALASLDAAPAGQGGFAFIVNDVVQSPMVCAGPDWEFAPYAGSDIESVVLANTGSLDMAYIAGPLWESPGYVPGDYPGGDFGAGVLAPGAYVDITSFYDAGIVAIVGSAEPFTSPDASYPSDEGAIPWPLGVAGSGGATTMYVAEIEVFAACQQVERFW